MALDTNIALGVRPVEQPNMLAQMGQMMQLRQLQQEYEGSNALRDFYAQGGDINKAEDRQRLLSRAPMQGQKILGQESERRARDVTTLGKEYENARVGLINVTDEAGYYNWVQSGFNNPAIASHLIQMGITPEKALANARATVAKEGLSTAIAKSSMGISDFIKQDLQLKNATKNAQISAGPGHRQATVAEQKWAQEQKQQAEIDALFGKPPSAAPAIVPMSGGGGGGGVPNALPAAVGATPAAPASTNMLVPSAQAPAAAAPVGAAPTTAAPIGDLYDQIKAIDAKIAPLANSGNPRATAILQQLIAQRNSLVESAKREFGGERVDMSIPDPKDPSKSITVKGQIDKYGIAQPLRAGAMPRDVDISTGTSIEVPVARPAPPAPVYKDIVDPTNEKRMITINVNEYKGGSINAKGERAPGVIGVAGKEPTAALREQKTIGAEDALKGELDNLRFAYGKLNEAGAIPSTARSGISNLGSSTQASDTGQFFGKVFGTTEQSLRDNIKSSNLRLLQSIKNATGMSAQELNSNMELKTWIDSLTNPKTAYETNIKNIDNIENFVKKRANRPASGGASAAGTQADPLGIR